MASIKLYSKEQADALLNTKASTSDLNTAIATKQDTLVSGTNIKTINGTSILGSGDIEVGGGGGFTTNSGEVISGVIARFINRDLVPALVLDDGTDNAMLYTNQTSVITVLGKTVSVTYRQTTQHSITLARNINLTVVPINISMTFDNTTFYRNIVCVSYSDET